ncbi:MAG: HigA family addiction module antidote protein [Rhodospirillales bacterium]|nr:HigA family addiction module antidote protein [Rhodospirillales bacterium]
MSDPLEGAHPGLVLKREILEKLGMSQNYLAHSIHVPANRIHDIVRGRRAITADTDLRLCKFFGLPEGYWLRLQNAHDLRNARPEIAFDLDRIMPYRKEE